MPAENIKFGIVISIYNTCKYLEACIFSLQKQKYSNFVVVAIDDASTDNSAELFKTATRGDSRFVLIENAKNYGVSHSRNLALDKLNQLSVDYVAFIDSDDFVTPEYLQNYVEVLQHTPVDHLMCGNKDLTKRGFINEMSSTGIRMMSQEENFWQFFNWDHWNTPTDIHQFIGGRCFKWASVVNLRFDESQSLGEDQDFIYRAFLETNSGALVEAQNYVYRRRQSSLSNTLPRTYPELFSQINVFPKISALSPTLSARLSLHLYDYWWNWAKATSNSTNKIEIEHFHKFSQRLLKEVPLPETNRNKFFKRSLLYRMGQTVFKLALIRHRSRHPSADTSMEEEFFP